VINIDIKESDGYSQVEISSSAGRLELGRLSDDEKVEVSAKLVEAASTLLKGSYVAASIQLAEIANELP
jgi:hypothetical protein